MAVIALTGNTLNYSLGLGIFGGLNSAFANAKKSTSSLHDALGTLKSKISVAVAAVSIGTAQEQVQKAETNESTKKSALAVAYDKLDALIADVGAVDLRASGKISSREDDFYKKYSYLKPECKKSTGEKIRDWAADRWNDFTNFLSGVGEAIANFAKNAWEWCKEHWDAIVGVLSAIAAIVAVVVVVALSVATFGASAVLVAAIVGAMVGGMSQLVSDVIAWGITGKWSGTWQSYVGAFFGGAVGGILTLSGNYALASAFESGLSTFLGQHLENLTGGQQRTSLEIMFNTGVDASLAALLSKGFDKLTSKVSKKLSQKFNFFRRLAGAGSYDASFKMVLTKLTNGQIKNVSIKTIRNGVIGGLAGSFFENIFDGVRSGMMD